MDEGLYCGSSGEDGLGIVEGLINMIYVLPSKAASLKKRREAKVKPSAKKMPPTPKKGGGGG